MSRISKVIWKDASTLSEPWRLKKDIQDDPLCRIKSVGYVVKETDEYIILSVSKTQTKIGLSVGVSVVIPKGCIIKIKELNE